MLSGTGLVGLVAVYLAYNQEMFGTTNNTSASVEDDDDLISDEDDERQGGDEDGEPVLDLSGLKGPSPGSTRRSRSGGRRGSSGSGASSGSRSSGASGAGQSGASTASGSSSSGSGSSGSQSRARSGPITIKVTAGSAKSVSVSCDDGATGRITLTSGSGTMSKAVGAGASCSLKFKTVAGVTKKGSVSGGGKTFSCDLSGARASCR